MNLPFLKSKPKIEYFLSIVLRDDRINAFIFQKDNGVIKIVNSQEEAFADSLDKTSFDDLLDAADKVISQAEDELNLPQEVQKTIFGLKESWVKDAKIKPENLQTLKKLSDSLGLVPIGFLTVSEAVVSHLQKEEGAPPSAIFVDVGKNNVTVSSIRAGKVIEVKSAEIHQSPVFTVDTLLKHFEIVEILPPKVVLLNEDEDLVQEFISHQWSKSLPFLHLPQIVSLESDSIAKAYAIGLANQTGAEVATEFDVQSGAKTQTKEEVQEADEPIEQTSEEKQIESLEKPVEDLEKSNIEFIATPDFFGFTDKDVAQTPPVKSEVENVKAQVFEEVPEDVELKETKKQLIPAQILVVLPKMRDLLVQSLSKIKSMNLPSKIPVKNRRTIYIIVPGFLILFFVIYYFFFIHANVKIFVNAKSEEKSQDVVFSTVSSDFKTNTVKADFMSQSEDGSATDPATGKKQTGDKGKGTVTIFNLTNNTITYPAQTVITSFNNLNFLTNSSVTVASSSGDASNPSPGKISVDVTAQKFGTDYNLPSGTKFTIGNVSAGSIVAKNDNPFSGGTVKDIQVVSKDDTAKVESDLIKNLEDKARSDIKTKLDPSKDLLPNFADESLDKKNFDKNVDDEAKTVTLTGTVSYTGIAYNRDEFMNFLKTIFGESQSVDKNNIELSFDNLSKTSDSEASAKMNIKVKIIPNFNLDELAKKIAGENFIKADNQITSIDQVARVEIKFSPNIPFLPKNLPRNPKNIKITVLSQ